MARDFVLSVMSLDRVGIVAGLTEAIAELEGNIDAMSQTVVQGYFTIILTVHFDGETDAGALAAAIKQKGSARELEVSIKEREALEPAPVIPDSERFVLTIVGPDRKGVVHHVTSYLASRSINIEDLYAYVEGGGFLLIAQLQVPAGLEVERFQMDVQSLWRDSETQVSLQHENIFLATNHIDFRQTVP